MAIFSLDMIQTGYIGVHPADACHSRSVTRLAQAQCIAGIGKRPQYRLIGSRFDLEIPCDS
jgi:hypothetical protein